MLIFPFVGKGFNGWNPRKVNTEPIGTISKGLGWAAVTTSNILTPLFLLCILTTAAGFLGLLLIKEFFLLWIGLIIIPIVCFLGYYWYFAKHDRSRLQTERHNILEMHIKYLENKGGRITDPLALAPIEKPAELSVLIPGSEDIETIEKSLGAES